MSQGRRVGAELNVAAWTIGFVLGLLLPALGSAAQCQYTVDLITAPPCGPFGPRGVNPTGINKHGHVCGYYFQCEDGEEAFVWYGPGQFMTLPRPPGVTSARAYDINDNGVIVGSMSGSSTASNRGFVYVNGQMTDLGMLPGGNWAEAYSVNNANVVTGYWGDSIGPLGYSTFRWQDGVLEDIGQFKAPDSNSGNAISESGVIGGWLGDAPHTDSDAVLITDGSMTNLGPIPGGYTGQVKDLNDVSGALIEGRVQGGAAGYLRSFIWRNGVWNPIGLLPNFNSANSRAINRFGVAVGYCLHRINPTGPFQSGFLMQNGQILNIRNLVPPEAGSISGGEDINDAGQIAYHGTPHGGRLTPINHAGDINSDCVTNVADLLGVIREWGSDDELADLNASGIVNVDDLLLVVFNWG